MHLLRSSVILSAALLVRYGAAGITRDDIVIDNPSRIRATPYAVDFSISDDLRLHAKISTAASNPDFILKYDAATNKSTSANPNGEAYLATELTFHNKGPISEIRLGDWNIEGALKLDKGLKLKVNVWAVWLGNLVSSIMPS